MPLSIQTVWLKCCSYSNRSTSAPWRSGRGMSFLDSLSLLFCQVAVFRILAAAHHLPRKDWLMNKDRVALKNIKRSCQKQCKCWEFFTVCVSVCVWTLGILHVLWGFAVKLEECREFSSTNCSDSLYCILSIWREEAVVFVVLTDVEGRLRPFRELLIGLLSFTQTEISQLECGWVKLITSLMG